MKKRACNHKTAGACNVCDKCFACCACRKIGKKLLNLADKVKKRDNWFVGGFIGAVEEEWEWLLDKNKRVG